MVATNKFSFLCALLAGCNPPLCFATCGEGDPEICVEIPQTVTVESGPIVLHDEAVKAVFTVKSNGWVDLVYSGTSISDGGATLDYPRFHKQDLDSQGNPLLNRYDHLETLAGVKVLNASVKPGYSTYWEISGDAPTGSLENLVIPLGYPGGPDAAIGSILPTENGTVNSAQVELYLEGWSLMEQQSGDYHADVMLTVTVAP